MKAAADQLIYWGRIDSQLWLRIFSKHPSRLRETYQDVLDVIPNVNQSLFNQGPLYNRALHQGDIKTCNSYNRGKECYKNPCPFAHVCNRCYGGHSGSTAELNSLSATGVAMCTQEAIVQQARPNQINPQENNSGE